MMDALDLFAGPGGWSLACQRLGITEYGIENDPAARLTRDATGFTTVHDDVWTFDTYSLFTSGLIASPPCQTFSAAGKGTGRKALDDVLRAIKDERWKSLDELRRVGEEVGDERTALVLTPLTYAWSIRPRWVALEQVPTVLPVWEAVGEVLEGWGYNVWVGNLQAERYGVPQTRKRAILIASLDRDVTCPQTTHSRPVVMADVLPWVLETELKHVRGAGMIERHGPRPGRMAWQPSMTVTGKARSWLLTEPGCSPRQITPAEAGVLQSFPAHFPWTARSRSRKFLLAGNAIPPLLAEAILREATGL